MTGNRTAGTFTLPEKEKDLSELAQDYETTPGAESAVAYARGLRYDNQFSKAYEVLSPYLNDETVTSSDLYAEAAFISLKRGKARAAENYANKAVKVNPESDRAYYVKGLSLEKRDDLVSAENAFRKGLTLEGPYNLALTNALALNLVDQDKTGEAYELLKEARQKWNRRLDVERNYRIVKTLKQSSLGLVPKPPPKPERSTSAESL